ncbi:MAG: PAS domain S-box protein, partial [Verrucomicrobia bacterium]|nr:PAS domain S-box protein [Verrucomicrobiota bacterium]
AIQEEIRQRLEHEEFSLRTVLSSMEEGVVVVDEKQTIRLASPAFTAMFGLEKTPVERTILEVLREPEVHRLLVDVLRTGSVMERQVELMPGRHSRFITMRAVPMSDMRGRPGALAVFRDVTQLTELEQVRREFVANVSHELRTPLAIFQGYVENLVDIPDLAESERDRIYGVILKHSKRLNALVEDLLSIARLEARKEEFRWESLEPGALIRELVDEWKVRVGGAPIVSFAEAPEMLPPVRVDRMRLEQVLHNLLENAFKHTPKVGPKVVVRAVLEDDRVCVSVEDNGSGIAPRDLPHIFERFYRADRARGTSVSQGAPHSTGLGLSIVKHIIAAHGGEVGAESAYGSG